MQQNLLNLAALAGMTLVKAISLQDVCTTAYIQSRLPNQELYLSDGTAYAIHINQTSASATIVTNSSASGSNNYPDAVFDYCDVSFSYAHPGRNDVVNVRYWLPAPQSFQNRYLSTGGGGFAINSGTMSLPGGVMYGASAGITDGGFGSFNTMFDTVWLLNNGTGNYEHLYMFGYQAIHELTILGKQFTRSFFNMTETTKLYAYYQACSEGGREGWSQIQRFTDLDGVVTGAPALRFAHQQVQHLYSNVVEQTLDYYPSTCEFARIVNATIAFCDPLDGRTDGVISRTDLCKLKFDFNSTIGLAYSCPETGPSFGPTGPVPASPAQNGTVSAKAAMVAKTITDGLHDLSGQRAYFSYQPGGSFDDARAAYNATSKSWGLSVNSMGGEYVTRFLQLLDLSNLPNLNNVTYDTLRDWMLQGWQRYEDSLQTAWPDLTKFHANGGKILHYHGESDNSIPAASSVRWYESVRETMYHSQSYNKSVASLNEWYRLFLVPGAAHCAPNTLQPNGPFPQTQLATLIAWVEHGITPQTLNGTVLSGTNKGQSQQICAWPLRPLWSQNASNPACVYDQKSINNWHYKLDAFKLPVY